MTPLERAARAVRDEIAHPHGNGEWILDEGFRDDAYFADVARAVLTAIREPFQSFDDPVAIAGGEVLGIGQDRPVHWSNYDEAKRVWQAMIDAALVE